MPACRKLIYKRAIQLYFFCSIILSLTSVRIIEPEASLLPFRTTAELEFLKSLWGLGTEEEYIGLSYRPAMLHRLAEFIPWNRFLGSINV